MPVRTALTRYALACLAGAIVATSAGAQPSPEQTALAIRQGHMKNYAAMLGVLGPMAQGARDYDAAAAQVAADNIFHLSMIDQTHYWPPGTAQGEIEGSAALPAIWENMDDFMAKQEALADVASQLREAAGTDLASLQAAVGALGQACGACHQPYRAQN